MGISKNEHIAIVGGGAFGLSTAFELSQQGYTDVTIFEKDAEIPSRWSAANDLNKIMRAEYEDPWYTNLGVVCSIVANLRRLIANIHLGGRKEMANTDLRSLLPSSRISQLCLRRWHTKGHRLDELLQGGRGGTP